MSPISTFTSNIINMLQDFGTENLKKALDPSLNGEQHTQERLQLTELIESVACTYRPEVTITETRPKELECDVVRFQNKKEKWVAFVGMLDGYPYEIFTGVLDDEDGIALPKTVVKGHIVKSLDENGQKRYDFKFVNRRGYKTTIEGLSERFNKEYWDYAKLISSVLRYRMPISHIVRLVVNLQLENEEINNWTSGVAKVLKRYTSEGNIVEAENPVEQQSAE